MIKYICFFFPFLFFFFGCFSKKAQVHKLLLEDHKKSCPPIGAPHIHYRIGGSSTHRFWIDLWSPHNPRIDQLQVLSSSTRLSVPTPPLAHGNPMALDGYVTVKTKALDNK
ncbi:hypothetical protein CFOL_v3_12959 [Cephalotus follicularis]|uniref:Uncharacterized protein n=1 Tax=Cephalotus follicularis TaxID=3775 RepID=A0A1Q3BNI1_CEPFO|nr:hypothetical protein CFOL_v3_12959 [Cephalotus follicularis]